VLSLASGMMDDSIVRTAPLFVGGTGKLMTHLSDVGSWNRLTHHSGVGSWNRLTHHSGVGNWNRFLRSPACLVRFPGESAFAPSFVASARISRTLSSSPNPQSI
jgi:hypothetical protein